MTKDEKNLTGCVISILALPFLVLLNAYAISYGWNSIFVAVFGVKTINTWQAFGISILTSYLTRGAPNTTDDDEMPLWVRNIVIHTLKPLFLVIYTFILVSLAGNALGA